MPEYWHREHQLLPDSESLNLFAVANHRIREVRHGKGSPRHSTCFLVRAALGHVLVLHCVKSSPLSWSSLFEYRCCVIMFTWCFASGLFPPPVALTSSGRCSPDLMVTRLEDREVRESMVGRDEVQR